MKSISCNLEKSTPQKTGGRKDSSQKRADRSFSQKFVSAGVVIRQKGCQCSLSPTKETQQALRWPVRVLAVHGAADEKANS
jgi:hypothetical protein